MNRGLKLVSNATSKTRFFLVTNLDPMNRGLKLAGAVRNRQIPATSYKPRPDE